jgi:glutathione S-transferase
MRKLYYTTGSPYARAVRIVLHEKGLPYDSDETITTPSVEERAKATPTLQVPTLVDGSVKLWDSVVIIDYLMATYPNAPAPEGQMPFAGLLIRPERLWQDKLVLATLATLGVASVTISQLQWSGVRQSENAFAARSATRIQHLLDWFEMELISEVEGFLPGVVSAQDVFLAAWIMFMDKRSLDLVWRASSRPKIAALHERLIYRPSFKAHPVHWWEPGIIGYTAAGDPIRQ